MCERFLKFIPGESASYLRMHFPSAFLLLSLIAEGARRTSGGLDGFEIGDALLGKPEEAGLSRKEYRTALKKLVENGYIEIILQSNHYTTKCEKRAIKKAIKGTLVNLINSRVWDINPNSEGHQNGQQGAIKGPSRGHKQERIRMKKKEEEEDIAKSNDLALAPADADCARVAKRPRARDALVFNFETWKFEGVTPDDVSDWKMLYPLINLDVEIGRACNWLRSNPTKSRKQQWRKFLTGWLQRSNDALQDRKAKLAAYGGNSVDRRTKDVNGNPIETVVSTRF